MCSLQRGHTIRGIKCKNKVVCFKLRILYDRKTQPRGVPQNTTELLLPLLDAFQHSLLMLDVHQVHLSNRGGGKAMAALEREPQRTLRGMAAAKGTGYIVEIRDAFSSRACIDPPFFLLRYRITLRTHTHSRFVASSSNRQSFRLYHEKACVPYP